ncbi:uncharacterized protein LOC130744513 [Lotus japonicus]|uniref:uncharacterized protein LOC130744513 n=1 Tax=Lotus japonicus TaxID=34305 RepID=UPI00258482C4|nr:uncharacterized protein LOC130744513 [Lotus japonicus]
MLTIQALSILHKPHFIQDFDEFTTSPTKLDLDSNVESPIHHDDKEEKFEEQPEFSFASANSHGTLTFADEIFDNGQIRPSFHDIDQIPLKKIFIQHNSDFKFEQSDISKEPRIEQLQNTTLVKLDGLNEGCNKSNSTGFSKLWRFRRDLNFRSNSNNKDAFVLLNPPMFARPNKAKVKNVKVRNTKQKTKLLDHEKLYVANRMRGERNKRRSFLPYKQNLIRLFTNANSLSKNLHPF